MFKSDHPEKSIGLQFWRLYTRWNEKIIQNLKPLGLTHTQFVVLAAVLWCEKEKVNPSQSKISELTNIDKMTLSKALKKLIENKWIKRSKANNDLRSFILHLSGSGRSLAQKAIVIVEKVDDDIFSVLKEDKKADFLASIIDLNHHSEFIK